jgi:hypothetical protein
MHYIAAELQHSQHYTQHLHDFEVTYSEMQSVWVKNDESSGLSYSKERSSISS